jgi:ABC-2 type transport system permease protein
MRKIWAVAQKELSGYFQSPIAYIVTMITLCVLNIFFYMIVDQGKEANLRDVFKVMEFLFVFIIPILTMKIFSEEKATGQMEFLMTTPTEPLTIVLGKYLGCFIFYASIIVLTGMYYIILINFSRPDSLATLIGYGGILLEGALFISVGIYFSSITKNQIIAAIVSYSVIFLLYFSLSFIQYVSGSLENVVRYIAVMTHSENFFVGIVSNIDVVYFLSGIIFFLTLTKFSITKKIWD